MYELYNTLLTAIRVYGDVIGFDDKDFQEMALTILVLEKVEETKQARGSVEGCDSSPSCCSRSEKKRKEEKDVRAKRKIPR